MTFKDNLKELRNQKALKQADLAGELGLKGPTISGYETGRKEPDFITLIKIADYFGVSVDYLIGKTNIKIDVTALKKMADKNPSLDEFLKKLIASKDLRVAASYISKMDEEQIIKLNKVLEILV